MCRYCELSSCVVVPHVQQLPLHISTRMLLTSKPHFLLQTGAMAKKKKNQATLICLGPAPRETTDLLNGRDNMFFIVTLRKCCFASQLLFLKVPFRIPQLQTQLTLMRAALLLFWSAWDSLSKYTGYADPTGHISAIIYFDKT